MISTRITFPRAYLTTSRSITAPSLIFAQTAGNNKISTFSGGSLIVIEHNLDASKTADYLIDPGPEGGNAGGHIVATGTPEDIMAVNQSHTGNFLRAHLAQTNGKHGTAA